jgi:hypothetical protein
MDPYGAVKALVHLLSQKCEFGKPLPLCGLFWAIRGIQYMFHNAQHYKKALFRLKIEGIGTSDESTERTEEEQMASMREHIDFPFLKDSQNTRDSWTIIYDNLFQQLEEALASMESHREGVVDIPYQNAFAVVASSLASNTQNAIQSIANTQSAILKSIKGGGRMGIAR